MELNRGGVTETHTLAFSNNINQTITVNGEEVSSPYTFNSGDVIVINNNAAYVNKYTINGTDYWDTQTINLAGTDIAIVETHVSGYPTDFVTITINT